MSFLIELLIVIGLLVLLVLIAVGAGAIVGIRGRKKEAELLKEAEERSNRKSNDLK